jgi:hypothetical protein
VCRWRAIGASSRKRPALKEKMCMPIPGDALRSGWGVVRLKPWHLAGVFSSSADAEKLAQMLGAAYIVKYGDHALGSPEFTFTTTTPGL